MGRSSPSARPRARPMLDHRLQNAAHDAVAHQHEFGVLGAPAFGAHLLALGSLVLGFQLAHVRSISVRLQEDGGDQVVPGLGGSQ